MARPKSAHAIQKMKLDISVKDATPYSSGADVVIDWFETDRDRDLKWDNWSTHHNVQFPAPRGLVYPETRMVILLKDLLKETNKKGLRSVAFPVYNFGGLGINLFVPLLLQAASATGSDAKIFLCTRGKVQCQETKDYLQSPEYQRLYDGQGSTGRETLPVGYITYDLLHFFENEALNRVKQHGCRVYYESGNLVINGSKAQECIQIIKKALGSVNDLCTQDIDTTSFDFKSLPDVIVDINVSSKQVYCVFDKANNFLLHIYGKTMSSIRSAKQEIERLAKPNQSPVNDKTPVGGNVGRGRGHNAAPVGGNVGRGRGHNPAPVSGNVGRGRGPNPKSAGKPRKVTTFRTKKNIEIQVYVGDILQLNVDCIINAANTGLTHEGGLAEVIAKAAGKDFMKQCKEYTKKHKQLKVGEACMTTAGKLPYKCVVHTVGPCWYNYKLHTQVLIDGCKHDLKSAVLNSLKAVSFDRSIKSIACPSISSGVFGVPRELCCVQYAEAVIEYSRDTDFPLKEIHFVDTNPSMVQMITETFDFMFNKGRPPRSYNEKAYISPSSGGYSAHGVTASSHGTQPVSYPSCTYTTPPGCSNLEFTCALGPNQNVYVYTSDILKVRKIDLIVCGDVPTGKSAQSGYLAKTLWETCGDLYKKNKPDAFKGKSEGDVVFCSTGKYKFVGHVILIPKQKFKTDIEREKKVNSIFHTLFDGMKTHGCRTMAIPLIGTGKGHGDPVFYAEMFIQSLIEFCSFQKSFICNIHLVNFDVSKTVKAIDTIRTEINKHTKPVRNPTSRLADRHRADGDSSRHSSASFTGRGNGQDPHKHRKETRPATAGQTSKHSRNEDKKHRDSGSAALKPLPSDPNNYKTNLSQTQRNHQQKPSCIRTSSVEDKTPIEEPFGNVDLRKSQSLRIPSTSRQLSTKSKSNSPDSAKEVDFLKMNDLTVNVDPPKGNLNIFMDDKKVTSSAVCVRKPETHSQDSDDDYRADNGDDDDDSFGCPDYNDDYLDDQDRSEQDASDYGEMEVDDVGESTDDTPENCVICMDTISKSNSKTLPCGHTFCADCIDQQFVYKEACPTCGYVCGIITGDQPDGNMDVYINRGESCKGYENCGRIEITYTFNNGRQGSNHPEPGKGYKGIRRTAYLPHNKQGKQILKMLEIAFDRKLIFTIGRSRTTGADSVITWNDIHHKTDPKPNTQFGYPDPTYLDRVTDELKTKGVTEDDIPTRRR